MDAQQGEQTPQQPQLAEGQSTEESKQTTHQSKGPRTDAGWAWVVLCGAFMVYFTTMGFAMSISVYLPVWMDYLEADAATTSLVISMCTLSRGISGPLSSALCTKFGPRKVTIVGGVITAGGIALMSLSPSITVLILLSSIPGLGISFAFVSTMQVLGLYFHKRYTLAVGIALAGISIGQLAFPALITLFIDTYGWKGSILITSAITFHICAAGALMRPVTRKKRQKTGTEEKEEKTNESVKEEQDSQPGDQVDIGDNEGSDGSSDRSDANSNGDFSDEINEEQSDDEDVAVIIADTDELTNDGNAPPIEDFTCILVAAIEEGGLAQVMDSDSVISENKPTTFIGYINLRWSKMKHFLLDEYGLRRLVHNGRFMLMLVAYFFQGFGMLSISFVVSRAASVGIDLDRSALLLSVFGVGGLIGRIGPGWFIDKKYISAMTAYVLSLAVYGAFAALMPAFVAFGPLVVVSVVMGVGAGGSGSLSMVVIRSLVKPGDVAAALGIMLVFVASGIVVGTLVGGLIYDNTKSYDVAFFTGGAILLVAALLAFVVYFLQRAHKKRHLPVARFWAKLPRKMKLKHLSKSASYKVNSKLAGSQNGDLGIVNPLHTLTPSGILENDAITTHGEGANVVVVNPLFESVETSSSEENTTEVSATECEPSPELPMGESCPESQPNGMDCLAVDSAAIVPISTTPIDAPVCINQDTRDSDTSSDGSESGLNCCSESMDPERGFENPAFDSDTSSDGSESGQSNCSESMDPERGFENPAFDVETTDAVSRDDDELTMDTSNISEFDTDL
ncbi:monocarboxylate transporter 5-like [Patiria miniata]|uniref:Major facilitator superfamily (MFS) profile domain-containing protein n=1 Tax=Patiria miniata TaxID=46514 RepID=A0A914B1S3_PATMI|nr:monocarboxylate transporter 5-like [Patiria miniata]